MVCGRSAPGGSVPACRLCWHRLPRVRRPRCPRCGATRLLDVPAPDRCPECADWPSSLPAAAAPYRMEGAAARVVHGLKFGGAFALGTPMGRAMAPGARALARRSGEDVARSRGHDAPAGMGAGGGNIRGPAPPVLVPVPLGAARLRERGYNQADLLARGLAGATGWPVRRLLRREEGGRRQARLGRRARRRNVEGRFVFRPPGTGGGGRPGAGAGDRGALLVDDVLTTGATAGACGRALQEAGIPVAGVVVFARALQPLGYG